ncbi:MAG: PIN domain-containing protein [Acetobacteraceae bacterium]
MNDELFFDTNILIYASVINDPREAVAAGAVARGGVISVQILNEFVNVARRKLRWSWPDVAGALTPLRRLFPQPRSVTSATHDAALVIAQRDGLAFYDSVIVASALEAGCTTLLSEDMQHGRVIAGRLTIRNPFVELSGA